MNREITKELLELSGSMKTYNDIYKKLKSLILTDHYHSEKISQIIDDSLSVENIIDDLITIYSETYTENELIGLLAFYKSDVGQSFISKTPIVIEKGNIYFQQKTDDLLKKIEDFI